MLNVTGRILKSLREAKGVSMDEMTMQLKQFNVSPSKSMISRWESGKAEPSMEYARILAKYFNVSLDYLLGLDSENEIKIDNNIDVITIAAHALDDLTQEEQIELINYAQYIKSKRNQNK